jgi:hypothetical protein
MTHRAVVLSAVQRWRPSVVGYMVHRVRCRLHAVLYAVCTVRCVYCTLCVLQCCNAADQHVAHRSACNIQSTAYTMQRFPRTLRRKFVCWYMPCAAACCAVFTNNVSYCAATRCVVLQHGGLPSLICRRICRGQPSRVRVRDVAAHGGPVRPRCRAAVRDHAAVAQLF